jgi:ribosomal protein S18 acetylase RimI-like enzyme
MPGVVIRDATPADLEPLMAIEREAFPGDRLSRRSLRRFMAAPTARLRVAAAPGNAGRDAGGAVGGYHLVLFHGGSTRARLYSIAVARARRGDGVGGRLLADAERQARAGGAAALRLEVRADNARAIAFYQRRRYRPIGQVSGYYDDGCTALRFEKEFASPRRAAGRRGGAGGRRVARGK